MSRASGGNPARSSAPTAALADPIGALPCANLPGVELVVLRPDHPGKGDANGENGMSGITRDGAQRPFFSRSRKTSRLERFFLSLALIVVPVGLYYFAVINQQLRHEQERAARSLLETEQRVGNLLSAALGLRSSKDSGAVNVDGLRAAAKDVDGCGLSDRASYLLLRADDAGSPAAARQALTLCAHKRAVVQIDLDQPLREGRHLREFDLLVLATQDGEIVSFHGGEPELLALTQTAQDGEQVSGIAAPLSVAHLLLIAQANQVLQAQVDLARSGGKAPADAVAKELDLAKRSLEGGVVQYSHAIGAQRFQLTLKAYALPVALHRVAAGGATAVSESRFVYLIGFRNVGDWNLPGSAIDPLGAGLFGAFVLGAMLLIPLVRLSLLEVHDSLTRHHARAVAFCTVGVAGLITVTVLALLANQSLTGLMRAGAERYAAELDLALRSEVESVLQRLHQHRRYYLSRGAACGEDSRTSEHATAEPQWAVGGTGGPPLEGRLERCAGPADAQERAARYARVLQLTGGEASSRSAPSAAVGGGALQPLSPLSSTVLVRAPDAKGEANLGSMALTYGPCVPPLPSFNVGDREYHRMLVQGRAWQWDWTPRDAGLAAALGWSPPPDVLTSRPIDSASPSCSAAIAAADAQARRDYVAQRLFNRRNAGKLMQFAMGLPGDSFGAAVTGSAPMLAFTAAVPPLYYGYAVFDRSSGLVLLHDDDQRSLVENLYVETDRAPELLAAVRAGTTLGFTAPYRGSDHLLHYQPVRGTGWGLLVTHPLQPLRSALLHASLTTVTVGAGWLLLMALVYLMALRLTDRQTSWAWPQWRLRDAYGYFALLLAAFLVLQIQAYGAVGRAALIWLVLLGGLFVPAMGFALLSIRPTQREPLRRLMLLLAVVSSLAMAIIGLAQWHAETATPAGARVWDSLLLVGSTAVLLVLLLRAWTRTSTQTPSAEEPYAQPPPFGLFTVRSTGGFARGFTVCAALVVVILAVVPVTAVFMHAYSWQVDAMTRAGLLRTVQGLEARENSIDRWLRREIPDAQQREQEFPDARRLSLELAMPGLTRFTAAAGTDPSAPACLAVRVFAGVGRCDEVPAAATAAECLVGPVYRGPTARAYESLLSAACTGGAPWFAIPPPYDALHWVGRGLAMASEHRALDVSLREALIGRPGEEGASLARVPGWSAIRVHASIPDGRDDAAAIVLRQRSLPLPLYGQAGPLRWGPVAWLCLAVLAIGLPVYLLIVAAMRRLTGLDRHAAQWADLLPIPGTRHTELIRALERAYGSPPRVLLFKPAATEPRSADRLEGDAQQVLDGLAAFFDPGNTAPWIALDREDLAKASLPEHGALLFTGFDEAIAAGCERRQATLGILERCVRSAALELHVLSDFRLARRLTQATGFPATDLDPDIDPAEAQRWLLLFSSLQGWTLAEHIRPETLDRRADRPELYERVDEECTILWPKLEALRRSMYRDVESGRITHCDQIVERVHTAAHPLLRRMWQLSTVAERLALYQLATRKIPNPGNEETLRTLMRRGLLRYRPGPVLVSRALERFTLEAEAPSVFAEWQLDASDGIWQSLRGPLLLILLLLFAALSYSSGHTLAALAAGLTTSLAVLGSLLNAMNLLRNNGAAAPEKS